MKKTYSLYEAKTHFSEIIRQVRERGLTAIISYHGQPVAEIRPVEQPGPDDPMEARIRELEARGEIIRPTGPLLLKPGPARPGGLQRFLEERD